MPCRPSTYFSALRIGWLFDHVKGVEQRARDGELLFGTMESWLLWNLTGGADGGLHLTDATNASRTRLMNSRTLAWDDKLLGFFGVPRPMLPEIRPCAERYGEARALLPGIPLTAALGDQQAALFGRTCFSPGEAKCAYGTGSFLLLNTGDDVVRSRHGLLTTVAYRIGNIPAVAVSYTGVKADGQALTFKVYRHKATKEPGRDICTCANVSDCTVTTPAPGSYAVRSQLARH